MGRRLKALVTKYREEKRKSAREAAAKAQTAKDKKYLDDMIATSRSVVSALHFLLASCLWRGRKEGERVFPLCRYRTFRLEAPIAVP